MDFEQLKELIYFLQGTNVSKINIEHEGLKVNIQMRDHFSANANHGTVVMHQQPMTHVVAAPVAPVATPVVAQTQAVAPVAVVEPAPKKEEAPAVKYLEIKSPMVGTFYRAPAQDKPVFVKVGDTINNNSPVCIIEAMKLFNEVKAEISGRIVKVLVEDASPVEYDQVLFLVEPI